MLAGLIALAFKPKLFKKSKDILYTPFSVTEI